VFEFFQIKKRKFENKNSDTATILDAEIFPNAKIVWIVKFFLK
jgi:hypothetical protein